RTSHRFIPCRCVRWLSDEQRAGPQDLALHANPVSGLIRSRRLYRSDGLRVAAGRRNARPGAAPVH
nr:hypothetical protein [Tanacetum cinerariifolium]